MSLQPTGMLTEELETRSSCTLFMISNVSQSGSSTGFNLKIIKSLVQIFFFFFLWSLQKSYCTLEGIK